MSVQAISGNPLYVDLVKSTSLKGVHKINDEELSRDFKFNHKNESADKKNSAVSDVKDGDVKLKSSSYKYLPGTPVFHSSETKQLYLEAQNPRPAKEEKKQTQNENLDSEIVDDSGVVLGSGSYIIIDDLGEKSVADKKLLSSTAQKWRARINQIYRVGFMKEPGTLVNLTV